MTDLEEIAATLAASGDYRILRRMQPRERFAEHDGSMPLKIGVILDTETTGLDPVKDEVIELGMVAFEFDGDGRVYRVLDTFSKLQEPSIPIPEAITKLTGITNEAVAGQTIDPAEVSAFIESAAVVIAHKAEFDRPFAERYWPGFAKKAWACSLSEIDWRGEGFEGSGLPYLLMGAGLFHDAHRAADDCMALLEVLARPLPSGDLALKRLLDNARKNTFRIWATNSPFERKDDLKARGYRWSDGAGGKTKAWWIDVAEDQWDAEHAFLAQEIYGRPVELPNMKLTAFDRFSVRAA